MIWQVLAAMLGVAAFGVLFHVPGRSYLPCALAGGLSWGLYLLGQALGGSLFLATVVASAGLTLYSRLMAIGLCLPSTVLIVTGIFPLVPGAGIYYTAYYLMVGERELFAAKGLEALASAGAIALGILAGSEIPQKWLRRLAGLGIVRKSKV